MTEIWRPSVTVAAVIEMDGKFLFVEELQDGRRVLNQPAGHLDPDETLIAACSREVKEETAHRFTPTGLVGIYRWYYAPMDVVLYLEEDVAYRADRVDRFLTLLWHPYEKRAIGIKLKGFRFIYDRMCEILKTHGIPVPEDGFLPLVTAFEVAMTAGQGAAMMLSAEQQRFTERYAQARAIIQDVRFDTREMALAA